MSSPIMPITGPLGPASPTPPATAGGGDFAVLMSKLYGSGHGPDIEAGRGGPPPELLDQMAAADEINQQLRESGRELRFSIAEPAAGVKVELHDLDGNALRTVPVAEALEIAAGKPVE
jgi:hypothetical protein